MTKRNLWILVAFIMMAATPADVYSQGFLKKLKQKAEKAVNQAVGIEDESDEIVEDYDNDEEKSPGTPTATDRIPKLRQSSVVWDGQVTPSRAGNVRNLLNELPPLPSVDEIVNPNDATRKTYYDRIVAVDLRVNELDEELSCSDEEMLAARDKLYKELEAITGLTSEEMKMLEDPNISEAEKKRLEEKMKNAMLGDFDVEALSDKAQNHEARMKEIQAELEILEKKEKKGTLTEADQQRAQALSQEMMAINQDLFGGMSGLMNIADKTNALNNKLSVQNAELERRLKAYSDKAASLRENEAGVVKSCKQIADDYEEELSYIYEQIYESDDVNEIHALYDQADKLMKNYRTRAAKVWLKGLQLRLDNTKKLLPEAESVYNEMAENELIPQCATRRAPLNIVTDCIDILNDAYADFPQPDVLPFKTEVISLLKPEETVLFAESGFAGSFSAGGADMIDDFKQNSHILVFNNSDNCYYEISAGRRTKLSGEGPFDLSAKQPKVTSEYGEIPLRKAGRVANYSLGRTLTLHDGTSVCPLVLQKHTDRLEFIIYEYNQDTKQSEFVKCTYKL